MALNRTRAVVAIGGWGTFAVLIGRYDERRPTWLTYGSVSIVIPALARARPCATIDSGLTFAAPGTTCRFISSPPSPATIPTPPTTATGFGPSSQRTAGRHWPPTPPPADRAWNRRSSKC